MNVEVLTQPIPRKRPPRERVTFDEFCSLVREDQKADLIDGVIYMASPAALEHEDEFGFIFMVVRGYVRRKGLGVVLGSRAAMKLSDEDAPEPDLMFISKAKLAKAAGKAVLGTADLVIEIISPGSRRLDLVEKSELYAKFGVLEYWAIDPYRQLAHFWKNNAGIWEDLPVDAMGIFRSSILPGFWLRVDWLFAEELPDENIILATILAGDPADSTRAS
ncbi:MAG: Uma2 family endonuclease [candidate division KSB1 bacterium]|nr:Uma2 family endonuclease [candidate division KSB1 bacterium]MDZ7368629.1 Uma2 family endonuclease [candidate division KSB1 bacterium]MDZ7406335.1 Uma2 family endonuclease [candidate division KSB1 bacterium]